MLTVDTVLMVKAKARRTKMRTNMKKTMRNTKTKTKMMKSSMTMRRRMGRKRVKKTPSPMTGTIVADTSSTKGLCLDYQQKIQSRDANVLLTEAFLLVRQLKIVVSSRSLLYFLLKERKTVVNIKISARGLRAGSPASWHRR